MLIGVARGRVIIRSQQAAKTQIYYIFSQLNCKLVCFVSILTLCSRSGTTMRKD